MKNKWLNLVLSMTNRIYDKKQLIIGRTGLQAIGGIISLIFLEMALSLVSLPLYLAMNSEKAMAYFADKGSYSKITFDYSLRRVLTVTGVTIIALIWAIKLLLVLAFPAVYGPLQLYSVSGLQPADILGSNLIAAETGIQTARSIGSMPRPNLLEVRKGKSGDYSFLGQGQPGSTIVLLLSDVSTAVYTAPTGADGKWRVDHNRQSFKLSEGNHSVVIFSYDPKLGVRSEAAPEQFFKVTTSWLDYLTRNIDSLANWSVVGVIFVGIFLIFLTI